MPSTKNFNQLAGRLPIFNVLSGSLYDFQAYAAAGQTSLTMFQVPIGQSGKTKADTNMEMAGALPSGKSFQIETVEVYFTSGAVVDIVASTATNTAQQADDVYAVSKSGYLELFIDSQTVLTEAPLGRFPPSTGVRVDASLAGTFTAPNMVKSEYATMTGLIYRLGTPHVLQSNQNFNVGLYWPTAVALPSGVAGRIGVVLRGTQKRHAM